LDEAKLKINIAQWDLVEQLQTLLNSNRTVEQVK
jgi:hypothetical protein